VTGALRELIARRVRIRLPQPRRSRGS